MASEWVDVIEGDWIDVEDEWVDVKPQSQIVGEIMGKLALTPFEPLKHPEYLTQTILESFGGRAPGEVIMEKYARKPGGERFLPAFLRSLGAQTAAGVSDIATTPLTYLIPPVTKALAGTKIGQQVIKKYLPSMGKGLITKEPTTPEVTPITPVQKITQALKETKPIRGKQEALYSAERARRVGGVVAMGKKVPGEAGYYAQLSKLKGELPKVQFEGIRNKITQPDIDSLFNTIEKNNILLPLEKITAKTGLSKLLGAKGGVVPTEGELRLLSDIFPREFIRTVLDKRNLLQKVGTVTAEVINVPRAIMASTDVSFGFRQGIFLAARYPKQFLSGFLNQFRYFASEKAYQGLTQNIKSRPTYPLMREGKLALTELGASLTRREEAFMSQLAEKIPVVGRVVRASNRAFTGFANKLRADVFDYLVKGAQKQGLKVESKLLSDIGNFVSTATGRGSLGGFERAAVILNSTLFSPRLMFSRINLLRPDYYIKLDPFVRKQALQSLLGFTGLGLTTLGLAKLGGLKVEADPRNADFGKIKVGNTRYDPWGGFQQYIRLASQLITGEIVSSTTGVKMTAGEGYKPLTRLDILGRFAEYKTAPVASFAISLLRGQTSIGEKVESREEILKQIGLRFVPMVIQDMYDLVKERGIEGTGLALPALFGVGVQTYAPDATGVVGAMNSVIKQYTDLLRQGRVNEAVKLRDKNIEYIQHGMMLSPYQTIINTLRRMGVDISKNPNFTKQERKNLIDTYGNAVREWQSRMDEVYQNLKSEKDWVDVEEWVDVE